MSERSVVLYRMKLPDHECPYGLLAKRMLEDAGIAFDDRLLTSREEVDAVHGASRASTPRRRSSSTASESAEARSSRRYLESAAV